MVDLHTDDSVASTNVTGNDTSLTDNGFTTSIPFRVGFAVVLMFQLIGSVAGGLFVCRVIKKYNLMWRTVWIYLFALAVSDVGISLSAIPVVIIATIYKQVLTIRFFCNLSGVLMMFFGSFSIMTVAMISIHKYITIATPLQALRRKVYRDVVGYLLTSVSCSVFLALSPVVGFSQYSYREGHKWCVLYSPDSLMFTVFSSIVVTISFFIPICVITLSTVGICCVKRDRRKMLIGAFFSTPMGHGPGADEEKVVRTMTWIIIISVVLWTPEFVYVMLGILRIPTPHWYSHLAYILIFCHGLVNPIIYFRHANFRRELKQICCSRKKENNKEMSSIELNDANKENNKEMSSMGLDDAKKESNKEMSSIELNDVKKESNKEILPLN